MNRIDTRILPPSIADLRGRAFARTLKRALDDPDFRALLFERLDEVDARLLPFLVREFRIEKFVEPGMSEAVLRDLLKRSYDLHARTGFIDGVRLGLSMIKTPVVAWRQWWERTPPGAPGTHEARVAVVAEVFPGEGRAVTQRLQRVVFRMVRAMQRRSQFVGVGVVVDAAVPVRVGAVVASRIRIAPTVEPLTLVAGRAPVFVGAVVTGRITVRPGVPA